MPYPKSSTFRFTLEEFHADAADLFVVLRETDDLPASVYQEFYRAQIILQRARRGEPPSKEDEWALTATERVARRAILDWNLPYPEQHEKAGQGIPLGMPEQEPDPFGALPLKVYSFIMGKVVERLQAANKSG